MIALIYLSQLQSHLILEITDLAPSLAFSVNCWRNTSMASCTNTCTTITCCQIHNGDFILVAQELLLCFRWGMAFCPWIWPRSMCCVVWLLESLWQCPSLASAKETVESWLQWPHTALGQWISWVVPNLLWLMVNLLCLPCYFWSTTGLYSWSPSFSDLC